MERRSARTWLLEISLAVLAMLLGLFFLSIGTGRDLARPTHGETSIQAVGKSGADAELARSQRHLERELHRYRPAVVVGHSMRYPRG